MGEFTPFMTLDGVFRDISSRSKILVDVLFEVRKHEWGWIVGEDDLQDRKMDT